MNKMSKMIGLMGIALVCGQLQASAELPEVSLEERQFVDGYMNRYLGWNEQDFYSVSEGEPAIRGALRRTSLGYLSALKNNTERFGRGYVEKYIGRFVFYHSETAEIIRFYLKNFPLYQIEEFYFASEDADDFEHTLHMYICMGKQFMVFQGIVEDEFKNKVRQAAAQRLLSRGGFHRNGLSQQDVRSMFR